MLIYILLIQNPVQETLLNPSLYTKQKRCVLDHKWYDRNKATFRSDIFETAYNFTRIRPFVHTKPVNALTENASFWKHSQEWFKGPSTPGYGQKICGFKNVRTLVVEDLIKPRANGHNIVGQQLPTTDVTCCVCWHILLLAVAAQSLKLVKLLSQRLPTCLLFRDSRSVAQQYCIRLHTLPTLLGLWRPFACSFRKLPNAI